MFLTLHLRITGRVQGVWFRASAKEKADALGITGWVRNCEDGSVEVLAQGSEEELKEFVKWCHHGPPSATITDVQEQNEPDAEQMTSFQIR
jgi:acylphosphatase